MVVAPDKGAKDCAWLRHVLLSDFLQVNSKTSLVWEDSLRLQLIFVELMFRTLTTVRLKETEDFCCWS